MAETAEPAGTYNVLLYKYKMLNETSIPTFAAIVSNVKPLTIKDNEFWIVSTKELHPISLVEKIKVDIFQHFGSVLPQNRPPRFNFAHNNFYIDLQLHIFSDLVFH